MSSEQEKKEALAEAAKNAAKATQEAADQLQKVAKKQSEDSALEAAKAALHAAENIKKYLDSHNDFTQVSQLPSRVMLIHDKDED